MRTQACTCTYIHKYTYLQTCTCYQCYLFNSLQKALRASPQTFSSQTLNMCLEDGVRGMVSGPGRTHPFPERCFQCECWKQAATSVLDCCVSLETDVCVRLLGETHRLMKPLPRLLCSTLDRQGALTPQRRTQCHHSEGN